MRRKKNSALPRFSSLFAAACLMWMSNWAFDENGKSPKKTRIPEVSRRGTKFNTRIYLPPSPRELTRVNTQRARLAFTALTWIRYANRKYIAPAAVHSQRPESSVWSLVHIAPNISLNKHKQNTFRTMLQKMPESAYLGFLIVYYRGSIGSNKTASLFKCYSGKINSGLNNWNRSTIVELLLLRGNCRKPLQYVIQTGALNERCKTQICFKFTSRLCARVVK